ncbi:MAG TPA: dihydrodipicolinate synthase family protein [Acidimicrobiia bacterium]|nr:dihydrodipicolinate synthase family protein [Acidimicrobiia bacterium]
MTVTPALRPGRTILGISAVLLPFTADGDVDWKGFETLIGDTVAAGLIPAVNMDTGYVQLLDPDTRARVLECAARGCGPDGFVAGAFVGDEPGAPFAADAHLDALDAVAAAGGTPVVFPSYALNSLDDADWVAAHDAFGRRFDHFIGFELGPMFVPYGRIYSLDAYEGLLGVASCIGAKHSSLSRAAEWDRLAVRDRVRPDFHVFTGNDLAIDMVCYGSDYLLGLSAFAPASFAERDRRWANDDRSFHELNDLLQYLGAFAFRAPVPAYRHDAALFLQLRGRIASDATPPDAPRRDESDRAVLADIAQRIDAIR